MCWYPMPKLDPSSCVDGTYPARMAAVNSIYPKLNALGGMVCISMASESDQQWISEDS